MDTRQEDRSFNNEEWAEIQRYVEVVTSTFQEMELPVATTCEQLPQAMEHINTLAKMTEEGTHRVLALTEAIETNRGAMQTAIEQLQKKLNGEHAVDVETLLELLQADDQRLMDITVALSFQDLVTQRVAKLVAILDEVQQKLLKLVEILGIKLRKDRAASKGEGCGNEMLRQLDASQTTALGQDLVDDILSEFGCA